ncbi:50S ribosomal protein L3 N(5)-glutamine methyltransferase [Pigmentiphaga sp. GD03639]|uniref:Ribosomal protein uL3 glutamine methyltransferase n=1 Tax=Pigmentiphaga daeguensis TaxID=414049 RepID=A0ABP3MNJ9_9BURK|nr:MULTISPECIES: 50S ribosomal protein L3 N(5)-glutamine methyltransferase [unclassified Pigmentiphaga]MDH2235927.1 50S ribosomal protein L3 N(5)-glutamine methyltransferase [Pigmentiphaga sp. GD03639]OVZ60931.1 50S ribosomal protein L3 N(5)-glutamine methyltransferase [Pigmentiphaga sp. NML030171]
MPTADFHSLRTVRDLIRYAVSRFNAAGIALGHGTLDVYDEAVYLVLHTLHLPIDRLEPFVDAAVLDGEREAVLAIIDRRIDERLPAPYLTNEAWLRGRRFYVDERVIVPRSYIAELLDDGLAPWIDDPYAVEWALDMCTGSGCLAIAAAETFPHAQVDAVDISKDALDVARINVDDYGLQDRIALHQSNLFEALPPAQYDLILCNPPYVNTDSMNALPAEYRHEPSLALAGGADGMDLIRPLLAQAAEFLQPDGILVLELGHEKAYFEQAFPHIDPVWLSTSGGDDKVLLLRQDQLV